MRRCPRESLIRDFTVSSGKVCFAAIWSWVSASPNASRSTPRRKALIACCRIAADCFECRVCSPSGGAFDTGAIPPRRTRQTVALLALNPNNPEVLAQVGWRIAYGRDWDEGMALVRQAIVHSIEAPHRYHMFREPGKNF